MYPSLNAKEECSVYERNIMKILISSLLAAALSVPGHAPALAQELNGTEHLDVAGLQSESNGPDQVIGEGFSATMVDGEAHIETDDGIAFKVRVEETPDSIAFAFVPENEKTKQRMEALDQEAKVRRSGKSAVRGKRYVVATQYFYGRSKMESLKQGAVTEAIVAAIITAVGALVGGVSGGIGGAVAGSSLSTFFSSLVTSQISASNGKIEKWIEDKTNKGIKTTTVASSRYARPSTWKIELSVIKCPWDRRRKRYKACQGA